jgi:hypothetical protein
MAAGLLAGPLLGWAAVGLPPHQACHAGPLSWTGWVFVVVGVWLSFSFSVRFVTWLRAKISSRQLSWELRRELGAENNMPPSDAS